MSDSGDGKSGINEGDEEKEKAGAEAVTAGNSNETRKRCRSSPESDFKVSKKGKKEGCMSREELTKTMELAYLHIHNIEYAIECNDKLTKTKKAEMNKDIQELKKITESMKAEMLSMISRSELEVNVVKRMEAKMRTSVCNTIKQDVEASMRKVLKEEMLGPIRNEDDSDEVMEVVGEEIQNQGMIGAVRSEIRTAVRELSERRGATVDEDGFQVVSYASAAKKDKVKVPGVKPMQVPKKRKALIIKAVNKDRYKVVEEIKESLKVNIRPGSLGLKIFKLADYSTESAIVLMEEETNADIEGFKNKVRELELECSEPGQKNPRVVMFDVSNDLSLDDLTSILAEQNLDVVPQNERDDMKPLYKYPNRRNNKVNWVIEVSSKIRKKMVEKGRMYVGWESCRVADHVRVTFCYKCQKFGHIATKCEDNARCGSCGSNHETRDCRETTKENFVHKCVMCLDIGHKQSDHKAGSKGCEAYKRKMEAFIKTINYNG